MGQRTREGSQLIASEAHDELYLAGQYASGPRLCPRAQPTVFAATPTAPRDAVLAPKAPGGPLAPFENRSTCQDLTRPGGVIAKDLNRG